MCEKGHLQAAFVWRKTTSSAGVIRIVGGTVSANGGANGTGIGGGVIPHLVESDFGSSDEIYISGGVVIANGGENAKDIGGCYDAIHKCDRVVGSIEIGKTAHVKATKGMVGI